LPKIPVRPEQVGVSGLDAPKSTGPTIGTIGGEGIQLLGQVAGEHAERIQGEHDIASTQSAINAFSEESLGQMGGHLSRKGANAKGSLKEYDTWYKKKSSEVQSKLKNARQKQMFSSYTATQKRNDNKSLSVHQARQHQVHMESIIPGTLTVAKQSVVLTPFNDDVINTQIKNVTIAIQNARSGLDNTADIAKAEADIKMTALAAMTQQEPLTAQKKLEEWEDDLGAAYTQAKDIIDKDAVHIKAKAKFPGDFKKQTEWVDKQKGVSAEVIRSVNTRIRGEKAAKDKLEVEAQTETTEEWAGLLDEGKLTEEVVDFTDMPNTKKNLWKAKIAAQDAGRNKAQNEKYAFENKEIYSEMLEFVDLNSASLTIQDIYDEVDPNSGGLTGQQAGFLVDRLKKNQGAKAVSEEVKSAKTRIKEMFNRGDFGPNKGEASRTRKARTAKADLMVGLQEWIDANPGQDPTEYLNSKIDLTTAEQTASKLNTLWESVVPFEQEDEFLRDVAAGNRDAEIAGRLLRSQSLDPDDFSDEEMEKIILTPEFNEFKTEILER